MNHLSLFVHYHRAQRAANSGTDLFNAAGATGGTIWGASWGLLGGHLGADLEGNLGGVQH